MTSSFPDSTTQDLTASASTGNAPNAANPLLSSTHPSSSTISPLEQEVLDEYTRLLGNMNKLAESLDILSQGESGRSAEIMEGLRLLERKTASVYTLMKASVYSIVLQQQIEEGGPGVGSAEGMGEV